MKPEDITELCRHAFFLQRNAHAAVEFALDVPRQRVIVPCDSRQVSRALTNLLQNALDAIEGRERPTSGDLPPGRVVLSLKQTDQDAVVTVEDNGRGLPTDERDRLTAPYVTTRAKGTGLGLAIVKKILEDHGGRLLMEDWL